MIIGSAFNFISHSFEILTTSYQNFSHVFNRFKMLMMINSWD